MFRRFFRACFTFLGALIGYECFALCRYLVTQTDFAGGNAAITKAEETWFAAFFVIIFGVIFFRIAPALTRQSRKVADNIGNDLQGISPNELIGGGGAEGIARCQHNATALLFVQAGQLGNRRGLADAVDADDQNDGGLAVQIHRVAGGQLLADDAAQRVQRLLTVPRLDGVVPRPLQVNDHKASDIQFIFHNQYFFSFSS